MGDTALIIAYLKGKCLIAIFQDRNEKLFYKTVTQNVELMMPIIYTPTVGQACLKYGLTMRKPRWVNGNGHISV